ncbi:hypothetical protein CfE428DRAFT_4659 [Chthoniobacter flavus Ellin428]|uniref:Uncharacterized protein n=1 Tax=Chthoniobacter flavus Ellin428 TaxID=497964 RepID=B4D6W9_9BACT|nr:hypothetical protein [Chthoniobacter flavus]EDY17920.1 hypothetical protein CfE428DRAFT_4659 [Chthoniobacter flavus Ellin428]TCO88527.1 hypothetical protein EV701_117129 [Chthoniobacter flavus]
MNAQIHKPEWQRVEIWTLAVLVVGAILLVVPPRRADFDRSVAPSASEAGVPASLPRKTAPQNEALPFTAADVVQYFSSTFETSAEKGEGNTMVFENHEVKSPDDRWRIAISTEGKAVIVEFTAGGDYGLSLARDFFESPLFQREESEQLYDLFARAQNNPVKKLPRFTVGVTYRQTSEEENLVIRFTAPNAT